MKNNFYNFKQIYKILKEKRIIEQDSSFIKISDGLVHDVRRIYSGKKIFYLKIRFNHFNSDRSIKINPSDIIKEKKAIELVSRRYHNTTAKIIYYGKNFLLLDNVENIKTKNVYDKLYNHKLTTIEAKLLGKEIRNFHQKMSGIKGTIGDKSKEKSLYNNYLYWRFGLWKIKPLNDLITVLTTKYPRQYIYGDFNPKNIFLSRKKMILVDLETFHKGNAIFDVGFLAGHIIFHFLNNKKLAKNLLEAFFVGYDLKNRHKDMAIKIALATIYYRIRGGHYYKVNFKYNKRVILEKIIKILHSDKKLNPEIVANL